jgi:quercetin dioxygenase-like cupin family protein
MVCFEKNIKGRKHMKTLLMTMVLATVFHAYAKNETTTTNTETSSQTTISPTTSDSETSVPDTSMTGATTAATATHVMIKPTEMKWGKAPNSIPAGAEAVVLSGDPTAVGPFVMRVKFPANYKIPAHTHSKDENITVISGELQLGMADKFDQSKLMKLPQGSFVQMKAGTQHFAMAKSPAIVQLHGEGPFDISYINPSDDPRKGTGTTAP